jgi:hypothetical protein
MKGCRALNRHIYFDTSQALKGISSGTAGCGLGSAGFSRSVHIVGLRVDRVE